MGGNAIFENGLISFFVVKSEGRRVPSDFCGALAPPGLARSTEIERAEIRCSEQTADGRRTGDRRPFRWSTGLLTGSRSHRRFPKHPSDRDGDPGEPDEPRGDRDACIARRQCITIKRTIRTQAFPLRALILIACTMQYQVVNVMWTYNRTSPGSPCAQTISSRRHRHGPNGSDVYSRSRSSRKYTSLHTEACDGATDETDVGPCSIERLSSSVRKVRAITDWRLGGGMGFHSISNSRV